MHPACPADVDKLAHQVHRWPSRVYDVSLGDVRRRASGAYSVIQNFNVPIQVQPQCFTGLCLVSWAQVLVYGRGWRPWAATLTSVAVAAACAGVEAALILILRASAVPLSCLGCNGTYRAKNNSGNMRIVLVAICSRFYVQCKLRTRKVADKRAANLSERQ